MNKLFSELIQVAIGTRICLSHTPSADEWGELYAMSKKQSLVGICFAAVQKLQCNDNQEPSTQNPQPNSTQNPEPITQNLDEVQYLTWMGMTAKIQQKNQTVDEQCVALQKRLSADGLRSSILKGQGVGQLYAEHLRGLRQSGDIDIYVDCGMEKALAYAREKFGDVEYDYINAHVHCYEDTEVELHWRAQALTNVFANRRLQRWLKEHQELMFNANINLNANDSIVTPSTEFNAFYILLHCYHHMFESGLGLRQLMDYYFVLQSVGKEGKDCKESVVALFEKFGMKKFASGIMWIMKEVFGLPEEMMLCEASEKEGRFLLEEVMQNGNFGHHDKRIKKVGSGKMSELWRNVQHNWHLASHYPAELLWQPVWLVYHFCWKRFGNH